MEASMAKKILVPRREYTLEFKLEAVRLAESVGCTQAVRRLDIPESSMNNWLRLSRAGKLSGEGTVAVIKRPVGELEAELSRLRRENASLKLDNEILKKAAAYFARESR
jgi:transposase